MKNFFHIKQCQFLSDVLIVKTMCTKPAPLKTCCTCFDDVNKILCVKGKSGLEIWIVPVQERDMMTIIKALCSN